MTIESILEEERRIDELELQLCEVQEKFDKVFGLWDKIIVLLDRIAVAVEEKTPKAVVAKPKKEEPRARAVVVAYCDAYKKKYGSHPVIDGKTAGLAKNLLKSLPLERVIDLVQAYLQMEDSFFKVRCHDFVTFTQNLNKVALALANGTSDPHEKDFWDKVFGRGGNDGRGIQSSDGAIGENLEQRRLSTGENKSLLENPSRGDG